MNLYNISPQVHLVFLLVIQFGLHRIFYNPLFSTGTFLFSS